MKTPNRDLLVLVKDEYMNEQAIENEIEQLNELLYVVESIENFCLAHEILDLNRFKVYELPFKVREVIQQSELKPFQFIFNKN
ncbi:MAG TPA: hypothetical protein VIK74_10255 [Parasegetibacter sp.]